MENQTAKQEPPKIRVVVRKRPLTSKELKKADTDILEVRSQSHLVVKELKNKVDLTKYIEEHNFNFDNVFDYQSDNQEIYQICVQPLVEYTFKGANTTCFAYGQTGSGKTFTMMGTSDGSNPGLYLLAAFDICNLLEQYPSLTLYLSFYEIYCGKLHDLLNNREQVHCREDHKQKVNIVGLSEIQVANVEQIMQVIGAGLQSRTSGVTGANADSSRSHAILQMQLKETQSQKELGKMSFIDLAGSERGADTIDQNKQTRQDGAEINKSLLALKECIRALDLEKKHLPFRGSKLTQVLKDSFTGNSKTTMIANVSPANSCCEHSLNTLRYADRVKELKKEQQMNGMQAPPKTKEEILSKQLMLARQSTNITKIQLNQNTLQPKNQNAMQQQFQPPQPTQNSFFNQNQANGNNAGGGIANNFGLIGAGLNSFQKKNTFAPTNGATQNMPMNFQPNANNQNIGGVQGSFGGAAALNNKMKQPLQKNNSMGIDLAPNQQRPMTAQNNHNFNRGNSQQHQQPNSFNQMQAPQPYQQQPYPQQQPQLQPQNSSTGNQMVKITDLPLVTYSQLETQYGNDVERVCQDHEKLVELILEEEEELINGHRQHIDDVVDLVKQEMMLLHEVDKPGSDIEEYVSSLDAILMHKMELISVVRQRLQDFYTHLKMEENLQKLYQTKQAIIDGNNTLMDGQLDDFDQNMMDEASINCPDTQMDGNNGQNYNAGVNHQQFYQQAR